MSPHLAIVIPCYNVVDHCREVVLEALTFSGHVIVINDGSTDGTSLVLQEIAKEHPLLIISFTENRGKGEALLAGLREALHISDVTAIVTMDADGQHRALDARRLAFEIAKGADFVIGERQFGKMPLRSKLSNAFISFLLRMLYPNAPRDTQSGMRGFSTSFAKSAVQAIKGGRYETEFRFLLFALEKRAKIATVGIDTIYQSGNPTSHFCLLRDSFRILKVLWEHWRHCHV